MLGTLSSGYSSERSLLEDIAPSENGHYIILGKQFQVKQSLLYIEVTEHHENFHCYTQKLHYLAITVTSISSETIPHIVIAGSSTLWIQHFSLGSVLSGYSSDSYRSLDKVGNIS